MGGCDAARVGVSEFTGREGDDIGPSDLRGAELRCVFMGERERGGGKVVLPFRCPYSTSVGSGIVPVLTELLLVIASNEKICSQL